ncbi:MAG: tetratricopeptide repeat-containing serine protease family protein [Mariprofundus sp.]|nr:tetratricopeptide repeat-containing serine protease family protein [Mariprofundus sp.]
MIYYKLMVCAGMLLIGMLGAINSWADDAVQCKQFYDADKYDQAFPACLKAAMHGNERAQFTVGSLYARGQGVGQSYAEAIKWFQKVAVLGSEIAQHNLGLMYEKIQNYSIAAKWYHEAADQGFSRSQFLLGLMYENGRGVKQDNTKAVKWYRKAAEQGHASAQFNLGTMYDNGRSVKRDYAKAVKWYRKAAMQGRANAQYNLGVMSANGQGLNQDYAKAVKWYRKAARQGHADAQFNLGVVYDNGQGVLQSATVAADWYYKAGISSLKQGKREDALTSVERIKKQSNVPNAFLANKLLTRIYSGNETAQVSPKRKKKESASIVSGRGWPTVGGYVVTNHHVVAGHKEIVLIRKDGKLIKASVAVDDVGNDLALLKPESMEYMPPSLPLADHPAIVGEKVFTIGYPHPDLMGAEPKLTQGIINAKTGMRNDPRVFQISVPIQSGNSGGPLLNMRGEVVGITTSKISAVKIFKWTGDMPQNVNYAVKSSYIHILLSSASLSTKVSMLPVKSAKLSDLAQRIEGSVLMIIAK